MEAIAYNKKDEIVHENLGELRKITINLSGICKKEVNRCAREFYEFILEFIPDAQTPEILPLAEAVFTTRRSPCGNGTATFTRFRLRVHQRKFDLEVHDKNITRIVEFLKNSPVDAQLKMNL